MLHQYGNLDVIMRSYRVPCPDATFAAQSSSLPCSDQTMTRALNITKCILPCCASLNALLYVSVQRQQLGEYG